MSPRLEITRGIAADPHDVDDAIADVTRMGEWPESAMEFSKQTSGIDDRTERNRQTISGTLDRLAAALEVPS